MLNHASATPYSKNKNLPVHYKGDHVNTKLQLYTNVATQQYNTYKGREGVAMANTLLNLFWMITNSQNYSQQLVSYMCTVTWSVNTTLIGVMYDTVGDWSHFD